MNVVPLSPNDSSIVPSAFTLVTLASGPPNVTHVIPPIKILPSSWIFRVWALSVSEKSFWKIPFSAKLRSKEPSILNLDKK